MSDSGSTSRRSFEAFLHQYVRLPEEGKRYVLDKCCGLTTNMAVDPKLQAQLLAKFQSDHEGMWLALGEYVTEQMCPKKPVIRGVTGRTSVK